MESPVEKAPRPAQYGYTVDELSWVGNPYLTSEETVRQAKAPFNVKASARNFYMKFG